ncbi:MAG: hypothetical protein K0R54_1864 [Clostridiaceae bacterium]|jgi:hypothetical protein|nr:hypothetical protein [Clostridiaceae bacterium]
MSSINKNGRGNLLITYIFPNDNTVEQINLENKIKRAICIVLKENGINKFVIADDDLIDTRILENSNILV